VRKNFEYWSVFGEDYDIEYDVSVFLDSQYVCWIDRLYSMCIITVTFREVIDGILVLFFSLVIERCVTVV